MSKTMKVKMTRGARVYVSGKPEIQVAKKGSTVEVSVEDGTHLVALGKAEEVKAEKGKD